MGDHKYPAKQNIFQLKLISHSLGKRAVGHNIIGTWETNWSLFKLIAGHQYWESRELKVFFDNQIAPEVFSDFPKENMSVKRTGRLLKRDP